MAEGDELRTIDASFFFSRMRDWGFGSHCYGMVAGVCAVFLEGLRCRRTGWGYA
jgi:hypothetical protein